MKKITLVLVCLLATNFVWAQKKNVTSAALEYGKKNFAEALKYITEAETDPSTKDFPKTWYVKGNIYMGMQNDPAYKAEAPYRKAVDAYTKLISLDPNYKKSDVDQALIISTYNYYNDAVTAYGQKQYKDGFNYGAQAVAIRNIDGGKRFEGKKTLDTIASQSKIIQAYCGFYGQMYDEVIPVLNELKDDPISTSDNIYLMLSNIYKQQSNDKAQIELLEEGRAKYPASTSLRNEELNYYIRTDQQEVLIKKLETAVAGDPDNAELQYNLGNGYNSMASSKEKPANYDELVQKAETAYLKAVNAQPENFLYNYNLGALYFNNASEVITAMNQLGTSAEENKKYDELQKKRDALFEKALPYLQTTLDKLDPQVETLKSEDRSTYRSTIVAMKEIYARQNKLDKAKELKEKLDAM
ncbi:MAG: hypothetical protein R2800_04750 [Flavipsychrobacter sp.]